VAREWVAAFPQACPSSERDLRDLVREAAEAAVVGRTLGLGLGREKGKRCLRNRCA
jgi:hypothetical protein